MNQFFQNLMTEQSVPKKEEDQSPSLPAIMTQDSLLKLIKDDPEIMKALLPHLPEGQQTETHLEDNLRSS